LKTDDQQVKCFDRWPGKYCHLRERTDRRDAILAYVVQMLNELVALYIIFVGNHDSQCLIDSAHHRLSP
jgi:hypothetical protein